MEGVIGSQGKRVKRKANQSLGDLKPSLRPRSSLVCKISKAITTLRL